MIKANFHTHSACSDGRDTPEANVLQALQLGMTALGFSEHVDPCERCMVKDKNAYLAEIARLRQIYGDRIELLAGLEVDNLMAGSDTSGADYIIGSTHYLPLEDDEPLSVDTEPDRLAAVCRERFCGDFYALTRRYFEQEAALPERVQPDIIGHYDLISRFTDSHGLFDPSDRRYRGPALEAMEYLVSRGILFEINCGAVNRGVKRDYYPDPYLLKSLRDFGGEIILGADAHRKELLLGGFDGALELARSCGFDHVNILTKTSGCVERREIGI